MSVGQLLPRDMSKAKKVRLFIMHVGWTTFARGHEYSKEGEAASHCMSVGQLLPVDLCTAKKVRLLLTACQLDNFCLGT